MILSLDVGNTQLFGGVFKDNDLVFKFRMNKPGLSSSDQFGLFLKTVLRENQIDPSEISDIGICSVVPEVVYSLTSACKKYFDRQPFVLRAGVRTGLKIKYKNPAEVGPDRIADAIAASCLYQQRNLIIIDFGTATTIEVVSKDKEYLGGSILPGIKLSMNSLEQNTSKLPTVEIVKPENAVGKTTVESIQSGLYHGTVGSLKYLKRKILDEQFAGEGAITIGTGGFASLFQREDLFDEERPNLVLEGILLAMRMNKTSVRPSENESKKKESN